jgi:hypothetical protein
VVCETQEEVQGQWWSILGIHLGVGLLGVFGLVKRFTVGNGGKGFNSLGQKETLLILSEKMGFFI